MACVILPSETARLVYGYLVKENLNDIALQFLESSPYLMDCCQIIKSGFQFNTKLMGKDLPELLQEYSVIHNLVNSKISRLCKSSLLYKKIKLRCESLPEILELILFWKYRNLKSEESEKLNSEKIEKNSSDVEVNINCAHSHLSDVSEVKTAENINISTCLNKNNNSDLVQNDSSVSESYAKLNYEIYSIYKENERDESKGSQTQTSESYNLEDEKKNKKPVLCLSVQTDEVVECLDKNKAINSSNTCINNSNNNNNSNSNNHNQNNSNNHNQNNSNSGSNSNNNSNKNNNNNNYSNSNNNRLPDPKFTMDVESQCEDLVNDSLPSDLVSNDVSNKFENPVKIVGIQAENQTESQSLEVFSKPLDEGEENINLGNSSVVFVSPDVGNVTINQEQSQIIVIPFDYYKPQTDLQNDISIENNKDLGLMSEETTNVTSSSVTPLFREQNRSNDVDENILTEHDFLKNRQLLYNLEQELYKSEPPPQLQVHKESKDDVPVHSVSAPVIVVSQSLPTRPVPARYRAILPKKEKPVQLHPVVVVHPLLENNKDITKTNSCTLQPVPVTKVRQGVGRRIKKKNAVSQKTKALKTEKSEDFKEPTFKPAVEGRAINDIKVDKSDIKITSDKEADIQQTNEEKENMEKTESKKNETPVFVTKRNSKRLSLSTPRRRSHIRALEFETPPKTNEEKKKSKTSPKARVEQVKVERKSVRNTLFKSPLPEDTFKQSAAPKENKNLQPETSEPVKSTDTVEPLSELLIPIATRSPNTKLSDAWENLTGVGCVIGQNNSLKTSPTKKMWDADLRCFILENSQESGPLEKRRIRKPEKSQKDNRKLTKKKVIPSKRIKPTPVTVSPSKISLTAKRHTYSINGNEEGSPIRTLIEDLKIVTPFKDIETIRPAEETPLTKLLRENINTIDIDLSMINTPSFPPTPSIVITPDLDDASVTGTNYYSPMKDCSKDKVLKITDYFKADSAKNNKKETKEMHEKVIDDLVSKAKEIIGLGKEAQEENTLKRRPSGKILSMVKIQMLTQCDKKLMENIPINEETTFSNSFTNQTIIGNVIEDAPSKTDLKVELEEKRKRALKKIKVVKENLNVRNRVTRRSRKRKRSVNVTVSDRSKSDVSKESVEDKLLTLDTDENKKKESGILHSTPYAKRDLEKTDLDKKTNDNIVKDIREQFPSFQNDEKKYPGLSEKSRKKLHYVENFLKMSEIIKYINEYNESNPPQLILKPSLKKFFLIFYKWLKHPHKRELNASPETNAILKQYLSLFDKVNLGLNHKNKRLKSNNGFVPMKELCFAEESRNSGSKVFQSDDDEREYKSKKNEKRKDEDTEDGVVSTLPLKKRKSTVQQVENKMVSSVEKSDTKNNSSENASQTQNFLQDIDVDRFLSQIHGHETR